MDRIVVRILLIVGVALPLSACSWINSRSDFERDPFVMSHLTKSSGEAYLAADDSPLPKKPWSWLTASRQTDEPAIRSASINTTTHAQKPAISHDPDYAWIVGRLRQRRGVDRGWCVQYAQPGEQDRFGGEIQLEDSQLLGLVREGDRVRIEGEVVNRSADEPTYRIHNVALLD